MNTYEVKITFTVDAEDDGDARASAAYYFFQNGVEYVISGAEIEVIYDEQGAAEQVEVAPNHGMFSPEGNRAVEVLIINVKAELQPRFVDGKAYVLTEPEAYAQVTKFINDVAGAHSEVNDTEPENSIAEALDEVWNDLYGHDCSRWEF